MKDLNMETVDGVIRVLNLLNKFSNINNQVEIDITRLSLSLYSNVDDWMFSIIEILFNDNVTLYSNEEVDDVEEILSIIMNYDVHVHDSLYTEFLSTYGYDNLTNDDSILNSEKFEKDFNEYYLNLGIKKLEFIVPLVIDDTIVSNLFLNYVPALLEEEFSLSFNVLLDIQIKFNWSLNKYLVVIYIVPEDNAEISEGFMISDLVDDFENLLNIHLNDKKFITS